MGCCQSAEAEPEPEASSVNRNGLPHDSSRAAINQPARSLSSNINSSSRRASSTVPHTRPNQPIRAPSPLAKSPKNRIDLPRPWTRQQLEREREAFFHTRVTADPEVWKALRVVCEMLRKDDVAEAQAILDAMGITCPTGRVTNSRGKEKIRGGVYDERGVLYEIPAWVLADPEDIVEDSEKDDAQMDGVGDEGASSLGTSPAPPSSSPRSEKGKGRMEDIGDIVRVTCRLSDRGADAVVEVGTKQQVTVLIRKLQEKIGSKRIRIMYLGKAWDERKTLEEVGWKQGHVVNAMVFEGDEEALKKAIAK